MALDLLLHKRRKRRLLLSLLWFRREITRHVDRLERLDVMCHILTASVETVSESLLGKLDDGSGAARMDRVLIVVRMDIRGRCAALAHGLVPVELLLGAREVLRRFAYDGARVEALHGRFVLHVD